MTIWAYIAFASSILDCIFTYRRVEKYGLYIELNPVTRWLSGKVEPLLATFVTIMVPSWCIIAACIWFNLSGALALYAGMRLMLNWFQIASIRYEASYDEYLKKIGDEVGKADKPL